MAGVKGQVQRRGVERRQAIVSAALDLFSRRGARGTSVADVAERVGISPPAVLHHFGTKNDLILAAIEERDRRGLQQFLDLLTEGGMASIRRLVEIAAENETERGLVACVVVLEAENVHEGDVAHRYFRRRSRTLRKALSNVIEEGQRRGEIRADLDAELKAAEIVAFVKGAAVEWLLDSTVPLTALYASYVSGLERDLTAGV